MSKSIKEIAFDLAMSRRVGFDADRSKRIGASEIGQCARKVAYGKFGIVQDDGQLPTSGFAVRGDVMEDNWTAPLFREWAKAHGGELLYSGQSNQISLVGKKVPLSATPDGLAIRVARDILKDWGVKDIGKSKSLAVEMKSIDPRVPDQKLPKSPHIPQTITQMGMIRQGTEHRPEWGVVAYVNASDYFDVKLFPVQWDERKFKALVNRAQHILNISDPNQLPPEGKVAGADECKECPWVKQCLGFLPWVPGEDPRAPKAADVALSDKAAAKLHLAKQKAAQAQQVVRDAEAEVFATVNKIGRRFIMGKKFVVNASEKSGQNRYNQAKLIAELKKRGGNPEACREMTKPGASLSVELRS